MSFWDVVWFIVITFAFAAYLMVMFSIITDLFRDPDASGIAKAAWSVALIFVPFLTAIVYMIARGEAMAQRSLQHGQRPRGAQDAYIGEVASSAQPADQIARAKSMVDSGVITPAEFERLKEKALA
jgi:hypothetical protein